MKYFSKHIIAILASVAIFSACSKLNIKDKEDVLPVYQLGVSPVLSSSSAVIAPTLTDTNIRMTQQLQNTFCRLTVPAKILQMHKAKLLSVYYQPHSSAGS
jgi:hypothetical protein